MPFRFQGRYVLLTYAQCGELDAHRIVCHLGELGAECIVGREDHADGGVHLHAFAMFERKFTTRNERVFDVEGRHPNVLRGNRTPEKMYDYAVKDGDVVGGALERPSGDGLSQNGSAWSEIILAGDRESFFEAVARLDPRALCVNFGSLRTYADWKYRPNPEPYSHPTGITLRTDHTPALAVWVEQTLVRPESGGTYSHFILSVRGCEARPLARFARRLTAKGIVLSRPLRGRFFSVTGSSRWHSFLL